MSYNTNICTFVGNVTRDPETRSTANGNSVAKFSIAVNRGSGDKQKTMFLSVNCWGKLGETVQSYAHKGDKILVSGALECNNYTNKNGEEKQEWGIQANNVEFLGSPKQSGSGSTQRSEPKHEEAPSAEEMGF